MSQKSSSEPIIIKKYANRRLYDTSASRYVTLDHLRDLVKSNTDFKVVDAKSGEDLTRGVLAQIIFEEESKGANLLPVEFLRQLIGFYGDSMQAFVPDYLRMSMQGFMSQQDAMREKVREAMGPQAAMTMMEEQTKRNMAMFQQAMSMFSPFKMTEAASKAEAETPGEDVAALRQQLNEMQAQLDKLSKS